MASAKIMRWDNVPTRLRKAIEYRVGRFTPLLRGFKGSSNDLEMADPYSRGSLDFSDLEMGPDVFRALMVHKLAGLRGVETIQLKGNKIGDAGLAELFEHGIELSHVRILDLSLNDLTHVGLETLAMSAQDFRALNTLRLDRNEITHTGVRALLQGTSSFADLTSIKLGYNRITDEGVQVLADYADRLPRLAHLDLGRNRITSRGLISLAERASSFPHLAQLDVSRNQITHPGIQGMARHAGNFQNLTDLDLNYNQITDSGARQFSRQAADFQALRSLALGGNQLTEVGVQHMAGYAFELRRLTALDLSDNCITDAGVLFSLLDVLPNLTSVFVAKNPLRTKPKGIDIESTLLYERGAATLKEMLRRFITGERVTEHRFGRLVYLGREKSGKTTLFNLVSREPSIRTPIPDDKRTVGFVTQELPADPTPPQMRVVSIDTGGQMEQLRSQFNFIYRNTARTVFSLVLSREKTWEDNHAEWYLKMLNTYHVPGQPKINVLLTVTHHEPGSKQSLIIPDDPGKDCNHLNVMLNASNVYAEKLNGVDEIHESAENDKKITPTRATLWSVFKNDEAFTTATFAEYVKVEEALRERFELEGKDEDPPKIASMKLAAFRTWLTKNGIEKDNHATACRYLRDCMTAAIPGLDEEDAEQRRIEATLGKKPQNPFARVTTVFNSKFLNNFVFAISMKKEIKEAMGFVSEADLTEMMAAVPDEGHRALTDLLVKHQILIPWTVITPAGVQKEGWLVPDQLAMREERYRLKLHNQHQVTVTTTDWLGEHRFFELMAEYGMTGIHRLNLKPGEPQNPEGVQGVWRNEFRIRHEDGIDVTISTDVFAGRFDLLFDVGSDPKVMESVIRELAKKLTKISGRPSNYKLSEPGV